MANLAILKQAPDFKTVGSKEFSYSFNEHRGGKFDESPIIVRAFGAIWHPHQVWIDRAWGDFYYDYRTKDSVDIRILALLQNGVELKNITITELLNSSVKWDNLIPDTNGGLERYPGTSSYSGCDVNITKCDRYITVTVFSGRYNPRTRPIAQFFHNWKDNSAAYKSYCGRMRYKELMKEATEKLGNKELAKAFLSSRAQWKWERIEDILILVDEDVDWQKASRTNSHRRFNKEVPAAVTIQLEGLSFPRKSAFAELMADLTKQPTSGVGWQLM